MRNAFIISLITSISILLMTCGETEIKPTPTPGPVSGSITDEQRLAALKECADFVNALGDLKSDVAQQTLVTWLKTRPEFEEAEILEGNVWAYFHDGRLAMFVPNWLSAGENDGGRIGPPVEGGRKKTSPAGRTSGQPGSNQVKLFFGLGRSYRDFRPLLKSIFSKSETQSQTHYTVTLEEASIENLKNTNDLGIFYINTHGGVGLKKPKSDNSGIFGLWTTDTTSLANERKYEADLNSYYLVYMLAEHDTNVAEWHYAITDHFVRNHDYMNFAENALVFINACNGMGPNATALRESMVKKAKGKKATYIGWTAPTDNNASEAATGYIFDRMLGTNMDVNAQAGTIGAEDPKQRPFDFAKIFDDMGTFMVGRYPLGESQYGGKLAYYSTNISEIILTPSIEYIGINDYQSTLYIKGLFGDNDSPDGIVTVGGVSVPVTLWSHNLIICEVPTVGPGSVGDVVVSVRGNKSNVVPLSEWDIPLTISKDFPVGTMDVTLNLKIRGDVHHYRSKPGEVPKSERPDSLGINTPSWPFSIGSTGTYVVGGERHSSCQRDECQTSEKESAVSRNGILPYASGPGLGYGAFYMWSTNMKKLYINVIVKIPDVGFESESNTTCEGSAPVSTSYSYAEDMDLSTPDQDLSVLELSLDENYNIQSGQLERSEDITWGICGASIKLITTAVWPTVSVAFPPKSETEARIGGL